MSDIKVGMEVAYISESWLEVGVVTEVTILHGNGETDYITFQMNDGNVTQRYSDDLLTYDELHDKVERYKEALSLFKNGGNKVL